MKAELRDLLYTARGRDVEIAHIARAFENMPTSIHLITGAPGSGKTTLLHIDSLPSQTPVIRWPVASGPAATMRDDVREAVKKAVKGKRRDRQADEG